MDAKNININGSYKRKRIFKFGEDVAGFDIPVLNEREIRAAAGLLFLLMFTSITVVVLKGDFLLLKYAVTIFLADILVRVFVNPRLSPSLIIGRLIVRNQVPEYVGARQKKVAWIIGAVLAVTMFILLVIVNSYSPITGIICLICLVFLFFETAFGICLGCKFYSIIYKDKAQYCPGEVCDSKSKQDIQKTSRMQFLILLGFIAFIILAVFILNDNFSKSPKDLFGKESNLVSVGWLEKNLTNDDILLFDASPSQLYAVNHIPGAISYDIFNYGIRDMETAEIEKRFQSWGISPGKKIVMYDQGGTYMATRLFFSLYYYGFPAEDLYVLDGGLFKWQEKGFPVTKDIPAVTEKGSFTITKINEDVKSGLAEFLTASGDPQSNALVEALDPEWHFGVTQFFNKPGHIPNAILLPSDDFFNPDKTFKSDEEIRKMVDYMDIKPEQKVYTHCGGGIAASLPFFALRFMLDYPDVKLYQGSQLEWLSDPRDLPFWTYDAPYLFREASWLKFRGGKMARMYGISNVVMVDVRSPEEFKQGHLPFAINIPSGVFSQNMNDPGKLAKILDSANVNVDYEAVIISGAGLTREAAIAFLMMEKLGQTKMSLFSDTQQKWAGEGFTVISDSMESGSLTAPANIPVRSVEQARHYREGIIVNDPLRDMGLYEKVYIASGKNVPSMTYDGKVIHIPYTELLNPDGTVKAAKDIWTLLSGAGVPRYAELVCYSDDPGEAAAIYFILKLMGYPDIKVLVM